MRITLIYIKGDNGMATEHATNNQSLKLRQWKAVVALKNLNDASDVIEIDYKRLDSVTVGTLKDRIANALESYLKEDISSNIIAYIKQLQKANMGNTITIDYSKIDDEKLMLAYSLKVAINEVLIDRQRNIYTSLTLNTNY